MTANAPRVLAISILDLEVAPKPARSKVDPSRGVNYCPICQRPIPQLARGRARQTHPECKLAQDTLARMEKLLDAGESPEFAELYAGMDSTAQNDLWYRIHAISTKLARVKGTDGRWMKNANSDRQYAATKRTETDASVLRCLGRHRAQTRRQLSTRLGLHHSSARASLARLVAAGKATLRGDVYRVAR